MGHALGDSIQDALIRYKAHVRLQRDVDAGQGPRRYRDADARRARSQAALEDKTRHDLGREKFLERVWAVGKSATAIASANNSK